MTQREHYRMHNTIADAAKAYRYTPGRPVDSSEARMISRLADRAQTLAAVYGEPMTRREANARVRENLAYVYRMAAAKGVGR